MSHIEKLFAHRLAFDVPTLSRFVRVNYGAAAQQAVALRIANYVHENQGDLAEIWTRILEDIRKVEAGESKDI